MPHLLNPLGRFAMWTAFPPSDYYQPSAPPPSRRRTTRLPAATRLDGRPGRDPEVVPTFTHEPFNE